MLKLGLTGGIASGKSEVAALLREMGFSVLDADSVAHKLLEAALLVEAGFVSKLDGLVVAWCEPEQQLERLKARGMSELDAKRRIAAQLPLEEKLRLATYTIDCSGTMESTRAQVRALAARLRKSSAS